MFHTFDPSIQIYPMQAAEHIMISMSEPLGIINLERNESMFLIPLDVSIFATSLMGSLYYLISHRPNIQHITYIWSDKAVSKGTILSPKSNGAKQILGKTISYNRSSVTGNLWNNTIRYDDEYFKNNDFWYTQLNYVSMLDKITVLPLVFPADFILKEEVSRLSSLLPKDSDDTNTIIVIADNIRFRIRDDNNSSEILLMKDTNRPWFDMFCGYGDMIGEITNIIRIEAVEEVSKDERITQEDEEWRNIIYQGILAV